jgi:hypothetical protein
MKKPKRNWIEEPPHCPYCKARAVLVQGDEIYKEHWNPEIAAKRFWVCWVDDAYVGTHKGSEFAAPLGSLANAELRVQRKKCHALFDPLWSGRGAVMKRTEAYAWLAERVGVEPEHCHIGYFREAEVMTALLVLTAKAADVRNARRR